MPFKLIAIIIIIFMCSGAVPIKGEEIYTNHLIKEKSPYLLQHVHNPVNWYPWGEEAFKKAKEEDKPIFLSVGYATCHWCHVMEEESFSNSEIAKILNKYFISIKVDRQERPDIDNIYMKAVMMMTGSGGWPLTVFLTPSKLPFFGGTYFPPQDRWGRPGLRKILLSIAYAWRDNRQKILKSAHSLSSVLKIDEVSPESSKFTLTPEIFKKSYNSLKENFDSSYGGFGRSIKFPQPNTLLFLLNYYKREGEVKALEMVEKTLTAMAEGGIYDRLGGGFHRYATDRTWQLPHFEKMLYTQALLSRVYLEAYQITKKEYYKKIARQTLDYVLREMTSPEGGFYSAEDADSPSTLNPEKKEEGAFYLWTENEINNILDKEEAEVFNYCFGIKPYGNIPAPQEEFKGKNILYSAHSIEEAAKKFNQSKKNIEEILTHAKAKLFAARGRRKKPFLDDNILVNWNGLMIASFAFASRVLEELKYLEAAKKAADFILNKLLNGARLLHRFRKGEAAIAANLSDYAFFIYGLIQLYEASFQTHYLQEAENLTQEMIKLFWDKERGGFFFVSSDNQDLPFRQRDIYDSSLPSANSLAVRDLLIMARFTGRSDFEKRAETIFKILSKPISSSPQEFLQLLMALDFAFGPTKEIVISEGADGKTDLFIRLIYQKFLPNTIVVFRPKDKENFKQIFSLIPFIKKQVPLDNKTTLYVCENYICKMPVTDLEKARKILD